MILNDLRADPKMPSMNQIRHFFALHYLLFLQIGATMYGGRIGSPKFHADNIQILCPISCRQIYLCLLCKEAALLVTYLNRCSKQDCRQLLCSKLSFDHNEARIRQLPLFHQVTPHVALPPFYPSFQWWY